MARPQVRVVAIKTDSDAYRKIKMLAAYQDITISELFKMLTDEAFLKSDLAGTVD